MRIAPRYPSSRGGTSLVEMLVTIAVGSIVVGMSVTLLISLLRTEQIGRRHALESRTLDRLARQFKVDANQCREIQIPPAVGDSSVERLLCELQGSDGREIEYVQRPGELLRREARDGTVLRHETFRVPANLRLYVASEPELGGRDFVALTLAETVDVQRRGDRSKRRGWRVDAELARDHRLAEFAQQAPSQEVAP